VKVLPTSLKEALEEWRNDEIGARALGKEMAEEYVDLKMQEWQEYQTHLPQGKNEVASWEIQKYLYA
jgi:glutamine synthetase